MRNMGTHLLLEIWDCLPTDLNSLTLVRDTLLAAADMAGATVVSDCFHEFNPVGVTGVVVIAESHISIHTWPEYGCAVIDVYTCGDEAMPQKAAQHIVKAFKAGHYKIQVIERTVPLPSQPRVQVPAIA